jgi:KaiC/GvpD/RAD55 family RecA-like ATPase
MADAFDPEFAGAADYARLYRDWGWQVVPAHRPEPGKQWKRPAVDSWRDLQAEIMSDEDFDSLYGPQGHCLQNMQMGLLTGRCSHNVFVLDLDTQKHPEAEGWWQALLEEHNDGKAIQTPVQRTGGGGLQYFFRAPQYEVWTPPTNKTAIGVDIRGEGGFAMLPPSLHESGDRYEWLLPPWDCPVADVPHWLAMAIDDVINTHGRKHSAPGAAGPAERTATPAAATDAFGAIVDGREDYMARVVWARILDLYRASPVLPSPDQLQSALRDAFAFYERRVKSRISEPGVPNHMLLEREGRGVTAFTQRWHAAIQQWDTKVPQWAGTAPARHDHATGGDTPTEGSKSAVTASEDDFGPPLVDTYEVLSVGEVMNLPDPEWLVEGAVIDNGLGFIYGAPGTGKSFVALSLALAIANKRESWWGRKILKHGPVLYISSEGTGDVKFRLMAWGMCELGGQPEMLYESPFYLIRQSMNFMEPGDVERLYKTVQGVVERAGAPPVMIVVDTVSRVLPGADENLQKDMTLFVGACDRLRQGFGATVMGVHHTSRAGNLRGSTVFDGAGDFLFQVEREQGAETGVLTATKIKAAADGWADPYRLRKVILGDLKGTTSLYAEKAEAMPTAPQSDWPDRVTCTAILDSMQDAWDHKRPWSPNARAKTEGRYAVAHIVRFDVKPEIAERLIESWLMQGVIVLDIYDPKAKKQGLRKAKPGEAISAAAPSEFDGAQP